LWLSCVIYPHGFWRLSRWGGRQLTAWLSHHPRFRGWASRGLHGFVYALLGFPLTFLLTAEVLISVNEWALGEQSDYRMQSDFALGFDGALQLPGFSDYLMPPAPSPEDREAYHQY